MRHYVCSGQHCADCDMYQLAGAITVVTAATSPELMQYGGLYLEVATYLYACMHACIHIGVDAVCGFVPDGSYSSVPLHTCMYVRVCIHVCLHVCLFVCIYVYMYLFIYMCAPSSGLVHHGGGL